jgi:cellulose synthase/poly-beta-1,6-N-acetylglucosamine synthase-like glycosyltransferase
VTTAGILAAVFTGLLLAHYVLYPLALSAMSALWRGGTRPRCASPPRISVLISARNEEAHIAARLDNLLSQGWQGGLQILVGSDASTDGTDDVVRSYADRGVTLVRAPERSGKPRMLQELVRSADGDVLVFTDADTHFAPGTLEELAAPFSDPGVGCVDGARVNSLDCETCESTYWRYERWIKRLCSRVGIVLGATGAVFALRRSAFQPLAPDRADDFELAVMARIMGFRCVFAPRALALEPSPDDSRQYRRMVRIVSWMSGSALRLGAAALRRGRPGVLLQLVLHKWLRWLSGFFLVGATVSAALATDGPALTALAVLLGVFHLLALAGLATKGRLPGPLAFPWYFWLMNWASMTGIVRMIAGRPVEVWDSRPASG